MIYAIEAVRYGADRHIEAVRWHSIEFAQALVKGRSEVVPIGVATKAADEHSVHVCFQGAPGSQVHSAQVDGRCTLRDHPSAPPGQSLADLPTF